MFALCEDMTTIRAMSPHSGLRERKKQKTRDAIVEAAFGLFEERGFEGTTLADIAAAADIAPRTFFGYFPAKEDVVFFDAEERVETLNQRLRERAPGETGIDAMRAWIASMLRDRPDWDDPYERCRAHLVAESPALAAKQRAVMGRFEAVLAEAFATDLGEPPESVRPRMAAAAAVAALLTLQSVFDKGGDGPSPQAREDPLAVLDEALDFLRGDIAALQERPTPAPS
jgi:AcrR family transcriptional regulator